MNLNRFLLAMMLLLSVASLPSCSKETEEPKVTPGEPALPPTEDDDEDLPTALPQEMFTESLNPTPYLPIKVMRGGDRPTDKWVETKARILAYMPEFTPNYEKETYAATVNKYGSNTKAPRQTATGRFYTKKIDGRWWIVDPEGYLHHHRGITSIRPGETSANKAGFAAKYSGVSNWLSKVRQEFYDMGMHGTGAFCTDTYDDIQAYNRMAPNAPMTLTPSMSFLSAFKSDKGYEYPDGSDSKKIGLVYYSGWEAWCNEYVKEALAPYKGDANTLGFFSDNEITISSYSTDLLAEFLKIGDKTNPAYLAAAKFMERNGKAASASSVTDALNSDFCYETSALYYGKIKAAVKAYDPGMLYLGSRLHGTPKYIEGVMKAAGEYCDIISINYYSRWTPELTTWVNKWNQWADAPFLVTEFYTKSVESGLENTDGAGEMVKTDKDRAYWYQHFTLALLEAPNCIGWHWFRYQDDTKTNRGIYDENYDQYEDLVKYVRNLNYNTYELINYFDKK